MKIKLSRLLCLGLLTLSTSAIWADNAPAPPSSAAAAPTDASAAATGATAATATAAGAAPAAAPAPTEPTLVGFDKINSGDTAWMLTSVA